MPGADWLLRPTRAGFVLLLALHAVESLCQVAAIIGAYFGFAMDLPYAALVGLVGAYAAWNVLSVVWFLLGPVRPVSEAAVALQLLVETGALTQLLYWIGGPGSPFVSLYLIPLALAATMLSWPVATGITLVGIVCYSGLFVAPAPESAHHIHGTGSSPHAVGMWLTFLIGAAILLVFLGLLAAFARRSAGALAAIREQALLEAQISALGAALAGAAHSVATPLSTIAIAIDEAIDVLADDDPAGRDAAVEVLRVARAQVHESRDRLLGMLRGPDGDASIHEPFDQFLRRIAGNWHLTRPEIALNIELPTIVERFEGGRAFGYCLIALLDNAADASAAAGDSRVTLRAVREGDGVRVEIIDRGNGPPDAVTDFESSKPAGTGVGLMIVRSTVQRLGGRFGLERADHGGHAWCSLPLRQLAAG